MFSARCRLPLILFARLSFLFPITEVALWLPQLSDSYLPRGSFLCLADTPNLWRLYT
uniref:Secreted protein n=1 Tax=Heterorhabditis bacteriophora TaxID=37862 RepID=A0A1I7WWZ7_HETBA